MKRFGRQFAQRLEFWQKALEKEVMRPVAPLSFSYFVTRDRLRPGDAASRGFAPAPVGTKWGMDAEYGWFRAEAVIPAEAEGQRLVLLSGIGGEQMVYLNGKAVGSIDREHGYVTLSLSARAGETLSILIESYAGHGPRLENFGPCPPGRDPVPPVRNAQCAVSGSALAVMNEDAFQLLMDSSVLLQLAENLPQSSLRRQQIVEALDRYTHIADFELPEEEKNASIRGAREALAPALACRNGDTAPLMWLIGQSHIDIAWLWPMEETFHKVIRTFSNQLSLMEEYPDYRFLLCEPSLLEMLEQSAPELYQRVLKAVNEGKMLPDGAFYVECDTNLPNGESLVRQLLWGKRAFREKFQAESPTGWQPDTFGFTAALPQLLKAFDIPYFATQKLLRADPECERFPYQDFIWEGLDGSTVQALSYFKNNARPDPDNFIRRWEKDRTQQENIQTLLFPFGYGDGGGGADRVMLEQVKRLHDLEGLPRARYGTLEGYFKQAEKSAEGNRWVGELYLAWHRGTFTSQRKTKTLVHELEKALHDAEFLICQLPEEKRPDERDALQKCWKTLLLCQFHDVASGVGIARVHREAERILQTALDETNGMIDRLARAAYPAAPGGYSAVNTLPFPVEKWVTLPNGEERYLLLPASGCAPVTGENAPQGRVSAVRQGNGWFIANGLISFTLCEDGTIRGLTDLRSGFPLQRPGQKMNDFRLFKDVECVYDAWELSGDYRLDREDAVRLLSMDAVRAEPACCAFRLRWRIGHSEAEQIIRLRTGSPLIESELAVDWQEKHKLLKVFFESDMLCENAVTETQFGHVAHPAHASYAHASDQYEVNQHRYSGLFDAGRGFAVLNRCIHGVSFDRGTLALSLLHAPCVPDPSCDRGVQCFQWAVLPCCTGFDGDALTKAAAIYDRDPILMEGTVSCAEGIRAEGCMIETVKPAESGGACVLRLWECRGTASKCVLRLPRKMRVSPCRMDESEAGVCEEGETYSRVLRPFEICTVRLEEITCR